MGTEGAGREVVTAKLVQVSMMRAKHAKQVEFVPYSGPVYRELREQLMAQTVIARFWVDVRALVNLRDRINNKRLWVIQGPNNQWRFMIVPDVGSPLYEKYKDIPQLFID